MWNRDHKRVPAQRGSGIGRMKIDDLLAKGYGVAGVYYGDIDPDFLGGLPYGVRALYLKPGQTETGAGRMGRHRGVGVGIKPRHGLSRNRQSGGREAGGDLRRFAAGQDRDVGRRARYPLCIGDCQLFR